MDLFTGLRSRVDSARFQLDSMKKATVKCTTCGRVLHVHDYNDYLWHPGKTVLETLKHYQESPSHAVEIHIPFGSNNLTNTLVKEVTKFSETEKISFDEALSRKINAVEKDLAET